MCPNEKMTGMANLIFELVCAWLNLTGYLIVGKVESQRLFTFKKVANVNIYSMYSEHLNTGPCSVFKFNFMPVPGILKLDHLKSGLFCPDFEWSLA